MSAVSSPASALGRGAQQSLDFDLNLAPIIDCFVVLIAFVMLSTAFASVGILEAGIAAGGEQAAETAAPPVRVALSLDSDRGMVVRITGKEKRDIRIGAAEGEWDYAQMTRNLAEIKAKYPQVSTAILVADNAVAYKDVVKSMDMVRKTFPSVLLGGF